MGSKQVENACETCGQSFFAYRYDIDRGRRFCSNECSQAPRRISRPEKSELETKYAGGASTNDLAAEYGVSKGTIYNWFRHHEISTRSIGKGVSLANTGKPASESRKAAIGAAHRARGSWQGADHPNFKNPTGFRTKRSNAGKRDTLGGLYVRSSWEHNYALILNLWLKEGRIVKWEYEPEHFEFPVKRGNRFYTPDFKVYFPNGSEEYHEIKGYMDKDSKVKLNRFAKHYPHKILRLIDTKVYNELAKQYKFDLPDWEFPANYKARQK